MDWLASFPTGFVAGWGAVTGTLGVIFGGLALVLNWLNRRDAVRERRKAEKAKQAWANLFARKSEPGFVTFRVAFHNPTGSEFVITEAQVVRPRQASIVMVYAPTMEPADFPLGTRVVPVSWSVWLPGARGHREAAGVGDFRLALPRGGKPWKISGSDSAQVAVEMLFKGTLSPPMREPVRITAKAVITL